MTENHVWLRVPTTWPRSASRKVAPRRTTTEGWPPGGDRQSRVRAGLSLLLGLSAGPASGAARQEAACGTVELRDERRSNVAMASSPGGCDALETETRSALRVPACAPGPAPAIWATQVAYVVHPGCLMASVRCLSVIQPTSSHTHRMRGGPTSRGGPLCVIKSFSRAVFCAVPSTTGRPPTIGHSQS